MDAARLDKRVEILQITQTSDGLAWTPLHKAWAKVEAGKSTQRNRFSALGVMAESVVFTLRRQALSLHHAIIWEGQHCFLTHIKREGAYLTVQAAVAKAVVCTVEQPKDGQPAVFPACITEKYVKWDRDEPMSTNEITQVLVLPKAAVLLPGQLVDIPELGRVYEVRTVQTLDCYKNEVEIVKKIDL